MHHIVRDINRNTDSQSENMFYLPNSIFKSSFRILVASRLLTEIAPEVLSLPSSLNWADIDMTTDIKFQGSCSSCYAFSGIAAVESAYLIT